MTEMETFTTLRPEVPPVSRERQSEARDMLVQAMTSAERMRTSPVERTGRHRRPRLVWIAAATTVAVFIAVVSIVGPTTGPLSPGPAAAAAFNQAAESVDRTVTTMPLGPILDAGEYVHSRSEGTYLQVSASGDEVFAALVPYQREVWIAADGSGRLIRTDGEPEFLTDQDQALWETAGRPVITASVDTLLGPGSFAVDELEALPTEPNALKQHLGEQLAGSGKQSEAAVFDRIAELLSESALAPELRVALYRAAATIDGIELLEGVPDRLERSGKAVGLTYTHSGIERRSVLIFDPATGELLGTESIVLSESPEIRAPLPVTVGYVTYIDTEIVDHVPEA